MEKIKTEELLKELLKRGFKWGYVLGHGSEEYASAASPQGQMVIADLEKATVLIRPSDLYKNPIEIDKLF